MNTRSLLKTLAAGAAGGLLVLLVLSTWVATGNRARAGGDDLLISQRNSADTGTLQRVVVHTPSASSVLYFDDATLLPVLMPLGTGFNVSGGMLNVSGSAPTWASITSKPTTLSGFGITDAYPLTGNPSGFLTGVTFAQVTAALGITPVDQAGARAAISLTNTGSGAASYNSTTGVLNVPTPAAQTAFNFSQPSARTLAVSTSYQAADNTKAAVIYPSYACQNATQVLASSACTAQVRMGTGTLTCSTGTVYYTQRLAVNLGVLITQDSTNPVPIFLPIGASFIICPIAGTFTISTVEQAAG